MQSAASVRIHRHALLISLPFSWHKIHIQSLQNHAQPAIAALPLDISWFWISCVGPFHFTDLHIRCAPASNWWASWQGSLLYYLYSIVISCFFGFLHLLPDAFAGGLWCVSQQLGRAAGSGLSRHGSIRSASALRQFWFTVMPLVFGFVPVHLMLASAVQAKPPEAW